jgi:HK97 family phage prohead protease
MPAVSVHHTATTDTAWDAAAQVGKLGDDYTEADLKAEFAWVPDRSARGERRTAVEHRAMPFRDVELRAVPDGSGGETLLFEGYACVTEAPYEMYDLFGPYTEVVRSGAFKKTLSEGADVPFLVNHEGLTLARTKSGTLRLSEDSSGLHTEADLDPSSPHVQALRSAMQRGDVDEMSFGFWVTRQIWSPDWEQRDILEVNLNKGDVSVVNYGANPNTAGATLNSRDLQAHLERLAPDERREVFDRLAAEFRTPEPAPVLLATRGDMLTWTKDRVGELREGKALSVDTLTTLQKVLDLVAAADDNVDEAQEVLSGLIGVPNPDDDEPEGGMGDEGASEEQQNAADLDWYQFRARALAL